MLYQLLSAPVGQRNTFENVIVSVVVAVSVSVGQKKTLEEVRVWELRVVMVCF